MDILEESRIMLELAINNLQRAGHDTEQFERTVDKIKQQQVKKLNIDDVSGSDLIAKAEQYLEEAKYKIENFNEYDDDFGRGSYFGVKRIVNLIKRHYR